MAEQYTKTIQIADLVLEINPESYTQQFQKYGSYKRTISGGMVDVDVNGKKLLVNIEGLAQSQIEDIKKRAALNKIIDFIDFIPIAEKELRTRIIYEDLGSEAIDSELVYLYIPMYKIVVTDFVPTYANNIVSYKLIGEEI